MNGISIPTKGVVEATMGKGVTSAVMYTFPSGSEGNNTGGGTGNGSGTPSGSISLSGTIYYISGASFSPTTAYFDQSGTVFYVGGGVTGVGAGGMDSFVAKFDGNLLEWVTVFGTEYNEYVSGIEALPDGNLLIVGLIGERNSFSLIIEPTGGVVDSKSYQAYFYAEGIGRASPLPYVYGPYEHGYTSIFIGRWSYSTGVESNVLWFNIDTLSHDYPYGHVYLGDGNVLFFGGGYDSTGGSARASVYLYDFENNTVYSIQYHTFNSEESPSSTLAGAAYVSFCDYREGNLVLLYDYVDRYIDPNTFSEVVKDADIGISLVAGDSLGVLVAKQFTLSDVSDEVLLGYFPTGYDLKPYPSTSFCTVSDTNTYYIAATVGKPNDMDRNMLIFEVNRALGVVRAYLYSTPLLENSVAIGHISGGFTVVGRKAISGTDVGILVITFKDIAELESCGFVPVTLIEKVVNRSEQAQSPASGSSDIVSYIYSPVVTSISVQSSVMCP